MININVRLADSGFDGLISSSLRSVAKDSMK